MKMSWNPNDQRTLCHSDWQLICQICLFYVYCTSKLDFYILDALISNRPIIEQGVSDCLKFSTVVEHAILFISFWTSFENSFFRYIYSPYFSVENFIAISEQLNKDNLSILHLNIRSLNANIDNFRIPKWKFQCYCSYGILVRLNCKRDLSIKPR